MIEMTFRKYFLPAVSVLGILAAGCSPEKSLSGDVLQGPAEVRLSVLPMTGAGQSADADAGAEITSLQAYLVKDGRLKEIIAPVHAGGGKYYLGTKARTGVLYLAANISGAEGLQGIVEGVTSEEELLDLTVSAGDMTSEGLTMTASLAMDKVSGKIAEARMLRSVARIDMSSYEKGVKVISVSLRGLATSGRIFPGGADTAPVHSAMSVLQAGEQDAADAGTADFTKDFSQNPLQNGREVLAYVPEQSGRTVCVEALVSADGGLVRLESRLPGTLSRNHVYNIVVRGNGASLSLDVTDGDWETGDGSSASGTVRALVDVENSSFPAGVTVNESRDTVTVAHYGAEFTLAILAEPSSQVTVDGTIDGVSIGMRRNTGDGLTGVAALPVSALRRLPGTEDGRIHIDVHDGSLHTGRIVLVFKSHPADVDGELAFGQDGRCDFGRYVEGEIARITLPYDMVPGLEFPDGESEWMKIVRSSESPSSSTSRSDKVSYRLLAGWKPNDIRADGRIQDGVLVFSSADGSIREEYPVSRVNWGLPVVKIGETWWTKYNLRGDSRSFEDQITCGNDPAPHDALVDMLMTMPEGELLALMGDQYQGGNTDGLPLAHDGTAFYHEGMRSSGQDYGLLAPESSAPAGYRLPSYEDFAFFAASDDYNLGGVGQRSFVNREGKTVNVKISERDVDFLGHNYGTVAFYDFESDGSHWVLYGLGHQWNTSSGSIARMQILMATAGEGGRSWLMEGYAEADRPGQNWLKYVPQNNTKTRTLRCIKSPVEYIYD